jgi:DNA-binding response OmpR family regulator
MGRYVLLIGDDVDALDELRHELGQDGFDCILLPKAEAKEIGSALARDPDAVIIDLPLPEGDERGLCGLIRARTRAPIVILCPEAFNDRDRIASLEAGADDCLVKPVTPGLVMAHVRCRLKRMAKEPPKTPPNGILDFGELTINILGREVSVRGKTPHLTPKEFGLLAALAMNAGQSMKTSELLRDVWGYERPCATRTLDVHVSRLRSKIERDPSSPDFIVTVPCVGYKFRDPRKA